jgi:hypothetical protein
MTAVGTLQLGHDADTGKVVTAQRAGSAARRRGAARHSPTFVSMTSLEYEVRVKSQVTVS